MEVRASPYAAVIDGLAHAGVRNIDMPMTPDKAWEALNEVGLAG